MTITGAAVLGVVAPFAVFPSPGRFLIFLVLLVWWGIRWRVSGHILEQTPLNNALLLLALMLLVSLYATYDIAISLPKIAGLILGIATYYFCTEVGTQSKSFGLIWGVFLVLGVCVAALGLANTQWINKVDAFESLTSQLPPRLSGLPGAAEGLHPNEVAGALLWVIPPLIAISILVWVKKLFVAEWRRWQQIGIAVVVTAGLLLTLGTFVLTQSRGGYVAAAATALVALLIWLWHRGRRTFLVGLGLLVVVGCVLANYGWTAVFSGNEDGSLVSNPALSLDNLNGRLEIWSRALYGVQDFPFTGMGMNTFRHVVHVLYPLFLIGPDYDIAHAHNEFLQAALDLGLPGLIAFIALYLGAFWMLSQIWRAGGQNSSLPYRLLALGLGGGLFAHLIYGLTDAVALGAKPGILFWMLLGLIAGLYRQVDPPAAPTG